MTPYRFAYALAAVVALLVSFVAAGCRPAPSYLHPPDPRALPAPGRMFTDVAHASGINFRWGNADRVHVNILDSIGHGCAFLDYDGDGRLDILLVGSAGTRLFHNEGRAFKDVSDAALPRPPANCHFLGCAVADYDGDGRPDIFLTGYGCTALYHNEGGAGFKDSTKGSGLETRSSHDWTTSAAWADVDGDGRLDLYVCRYVVFTQSSKQFCSQKALDGNNVGIPCAPTTYLSDKGSLYRNEGGGRFRDVTYAAGLRDAHGNALGCMFCDFNGDGLPDLYVANDLKLGDLYVNLGRGRFRNIGSESGVALGADGGVMSGMGIDWGDYDNDGKFDLLAASYARQPKALFHNDGQSLFTNRSYASGIGSAALLPLAFGACFADVDNDGALDIMFVNGHVDSQAERVDATTNYFQSAQLFHNQGGGQFVEASAQAGPDFTRKIVGRGIAVGDFDGDGRLDLLVVDDEGAPLLLHNETRNANHWISLRCLWGPGRTDAVGARVTVTAGALKQIREVRSGGSYLSANDPALHFGLGEHATIDRIEVRWPDGKTSNFTNVPANALYRLSPRPATPLRLTAR